MEQVATLSGNELSKEESSETSPKPIRRSKKIDDTFSSDSSNTSPKRSRRKSKRHNDHKRDDEPTERSIVEVPVNDNKDNEKEDEDEQIDQSLMEKLKDEKEIVKRKLQKKEEELNDIQTQENSSETKIEVLGTETVGTSSDDETDESRSRSASNADEINYLEDPNGYRNPKLRPSLLPQPEFEENVILDVLLAIRTCVLGVRKAKTFELEEKAFETDMQYKISRTGNQKRFVIKDFAPKVFRNLRSIFRITPEDYLQSWSNTNLSREKSNGKSNSTFITSYDRKYMLKTLTKSESKTLRHILPDYYQHMNRFSSSFLVKILGHHRIDVKGRKLYFIVQENIFGAQKMIHEFYDLKGSTLGRELTEEEKKNGKKSVLKDNEFLINKRKLVLSSSIKDAFLKQIEDDTKLLIAHDLMDYSMLLGVHQISSVSVQTELEVEQKVETQHSLKRVPSLVFFCEDIQEIPESKPFIVRTLRKKSMSFNGDTRSIPNSGLSQRVAGGIPSFENGRMKEIYFVGIIDFLQKYNSKKRIAHMAKSIRFAREEVSTVNPPYYANRFLDFISRATESQDIGCEDDEKDSKENTNGDNRILDATRSIKEHRRSSSANNYSSL